MALPRPASSNIRGSGKGQTTTSLSMPTLIPFFRAMSMASTAMREVMP
jgi:hypothetical protein